MMYKVVVIMALMVCMPSNIYAMDTLYNIGFEWFEDKNEDDAVQRTNVEDKANSTMISYLRLFVENFSNLLKLKKT